MDNIKLLYIDLFCGAGGTSTGVEHAVVNGEKCAKYRVRQPRRQRDRSFYKRKPVLIKMRRKKTLSAVRDIANIRYLASVRALNKIIKAQRRANEALCDYDFLMGLLARSSGEQKYKFAQNGYQN